jgi:hypothetical protein
MYRIWDLAAHDHNVKDNHYKFIVQ